MAHQVGTYSHEELWQMAQTITQTEAAQFEAIRLMLAAGNSQATIRTALGLSERTWFRRWNRYRDLAGIPRNQIKRKHKPCRT